MKKLFVFCVIGMFIPLIMAMGAAPDKGSPDTIPLPKDTFSATYVDQMDVITECTGVSINGKTFIEGMKGEGTYTIAFGNIKEISFFQKKGTLTGTVTLMSDEQINLVLHKEHRAYGKTAYGTFQITLAQLNRMILAR